MLRWEPTPEVGVGFPFLGISPFTNTEGLQSLDLIQLNEKKAHGDIKMILLHKLSVSQTTIRKENPFLFMVHVLLFNLKICYST